MAAQAYAMFNRKLYDMLEDLAASFPIVPEFGIAISPTARMLMNIDPTQAQRMFHEYVALPFEMHILARDDGFLLSQERFGPTGGVGTADMISLIKGVWRDASNDNKDAIWKHLHVLIILSRRCLAAVSAAPAPV